MRLDPLLWSALLLGACTSEPKEARHPPAPSSTATASTAAAPTTASTAASGAPTTAHVRSPEEQQGQISMDPSSFWLGGAAGKAATPEDSCGVASANIARSAAQILQGAGRQPPAPSSPWDHRSKPQYLDRMIERFALNRSELQLLYRNGFVALERVESPSYPDALHELYQSQLPIYLSVDAVLHGIYQSHHKLLAQVEHEMAMRLQLVVDSIHRELPDAAASYPEEVVQDLEIYLSVARALAHDERAPMFQLKVNGADDTTTRKADELLSGIYEASGIITTPLFGRERVIDLSQYRPRGHYEKDDNGVLRPYFRAAMWLSRLELNLVSRSSRSSAPGFVPDPRPTPREVLIALALADLVERAKMTVPVEELDKIWAAFSGVREDVSIHDLAELRRRAGIRSLKSADAPDRLVAAIGNDFQRTTRVHYMPQGSDVLPAIATFLGPRITPDAAAIEQLVHSAIPSRYRVGAADVGYLLGHDRADHYLREDKTKFPALSSQLQKGRGLMAKSSQGDLFGSWFSAILALSEEPIGALPSFMRTKAFADMRLTSALVGYGQIRHSHVLIAGQAYDEGGCEVPDGFVDPAPEVYRRLIRYAETGRRLMAELSLPREQQYFTRLGYLLRVILTIAEDELEGRPLSEEQRRFMSMATEITPPSSDGPGRFDGWYFEMHRNVGESFDEPGFISDYYTSTNLAEASYIGARPPVMGLFTVDIGGAPRVMAGPVAIGFEHHAPLTGRLDRSTAASLKRATASWSESYLSPMPSDPEITLVHLYVNLPERAPKAWYFAVHSKVRRDVRIELLDHHREVVAVGVGVAGPIPSAVHVLERAGKPYPEVLRVRSGDYSRMIPRVDFAAMTTEGEGADPYGVIPMEVQNTLAKQIERWWHPLRRPRQRG